MDCTQNNPKAALMQAQSHPEEGPNQAQCRPEECSMNLEKSRDFDYTSRSRISNVEDYLDNEIVFYMPRIDQI